MQLSHHFGNTMPVVIPEQYLLDNIGVLEDIEPDGISFKHNNIIYWQNNNYF